MAKFKRVLLVEDDPHDVELTLTALEDNHLVNEVEVVNDGEAALDYLYHRGAYTAKPGGNPAVVLLDLKLPKINGIEVLRQIRSDEKMKMIPIVILTSSREEKDLVESYRLSVNAYVVKPVKFGEFIESVRQIGLFWAITNETPPGSIKRGDTRTW